MTGQGRGVLRRLFTGPGRKTRSSPPGVPRRVGSISPEYESELLLEIRAGDESLGEIWDVVVAHVNAYVPDQIDAIGKDVRALITDAEGVPRTSYVLDKGESDFSWGASGWGAWVVMKIADAAVDVGVLKGLEALVRRYGGRNEWADSVSEDVAREHADRFVSHYFVAGAGAKLRSRAFESEAGTHTFSYLVDGEIEVEVTIGAVDGHPVVRGRRITGEVR